MIKPKILCIVGESGSGKTTIAEYIESKYGIPMIQSHTERPPRYEGENGHTFHDNKEDFLKLKPEDKLAETNINGYNYWCETKDVNHPIMTYIIDEKGLKMFLNDYHDRFDIKSLRIICNQDAIAERIDVDRIKRNVLFSIPLDRYDYRLQNNGGMLNLLESVDMLMSVAYGVKPCN
jgi:guanylate kinase